MAKPCVLCMYIKHTTTKAALAAVTTTTTTESHVSRCALVCFAQKPIHSIPYDALTASLYRT